MDATRADVEFTAEVVQIAIDEGATTINIPDTVGYATPRRVRRVPDAGSTSSCPALRDVVLSVHCHDDLGLAVANSLAGVQAGARQVECAINGIGERAGNASLEEFVMLLRHARRRPRLRDRGQHARDRAHQPHGLAPHGLPGAAEQGDRRAATRSRTSPGIHQDGVLKDRSTYEIMDATTIGLEGNDLVLGKHSGRHALKSALQELGFQVEGQALNTAFKRFKEIADRKKTSRRWTWRRS